MKSRKEKRMTATRNNDAARTSQPQEPTYIDILLDETGSMMSCHGATVQGFNAFVAEQREIEGLCFLTLSKFDSDGIRTPYQNLALDMVPPLSFHPGMWTNLYDVVGDRVTALLDQKRNGRSLVVVITDGQDNKSQRFNAASVSRVVQDAMQQGVSFLYFGAGPGAKETALQMGFPETLVTVFETAHIAQTMNVMSAQTTAFRAA
jgi:hypothetical protein